MTTRHYALPVESTRWHVGGTTETVFNWEYDEPRDRLLTLYEKGKRKQWDAQTLIDWSMDLDLEDQAFFPDMYVPIYGSPSWERMNRAQKDTVRHHYSAWLNSQFLHGEQGALICSAKIVQTVPDIDSKFYAATQVMDEARHVEAYNKFLLEKLELAYPIHPELALLLDQTVADSRWDITYLGMQVMIEGVALAAFSLIRDFTEHPLPRSLNAYVMKDEARHVAFGLLALQDAYRDLTDAERREREEFVIEAARLLRDRIVAEELYENLGLPVDECLDYLEQSQIMSVYRQQLFARVVPTVKRIGLWSERIQQAFIDLDVLAFANFEPDEMAANDERVADELEAAIAALRSERPNGTPATRAQELAATIAAGDD
ncbi:MAG TPA: ferritin-like domain-containing protein [Acidimicrobiia bacterium]|nr:ferritin-like domain-containing protein [Acidimicrobiia bacterium]